MTPRAYEDAVAKLIGRLVSGVELVTPGIEQRKKLTGKTGQAYEIDLLYRYRLGGLEYLTIVECKHWKERVGVDIINQLYSIQQDVGAHKAAVVTTRGFQKGAITVASKNGIALICFVRGTPQFLTYIDGGWSEICKLIESDNSSLHYPPDSSIGVVFPTRSPRRYIANRYGMEIAQLLVSDGFLSFDQIPRPELRATVERQIRRMDLSWVIDYENEERAGLPVDVGSRSELRAMNTKVAMLLREVGLTNEELLTQLEELKAKAGPIGSYPTKEDHIHYFDRIRTSLKSEIVVRFMLNIGSPLGFLEREWGEVLMSGLDHLVPKVAVAIVEGGTWSDQATNSDIDKASARLIEEAMHELYESSSEELANGGSDSFKDWLSKPLVATEESDSTES